MKKILIVEDNDDYRNLLAREMIKEGYQVDQADSPIKGMEHLASKKYDVVISDLHLPIMSGLLFTESVKNVSPSTVCIILTGDPDETTELESIANNIDLYIEKNRSFSVIIQYVEKLINEYEEVRSTNLVYISRTENIKLEVGKHLVSKNGENIDLTPKEFEILKIFLSNKNRVLSRDEIIELAWEEPAAELDIRLVDNQIKKLRQKLKSVSITTIRGYGYRWNETI